MSSEESNEFSIQVLSIAVNVPYFVCAIVCVEGKKSGDQSREASDREGKTMLFLIRTAFWLMIIVLLLPTDEQQRSEVYGTAQAAVHDVATFCDRNPETCTRGQDAFGVLVQKAQFGAQMLMDLINGKDDAGTFEQPDSEMPSLFAPARFDTGASQDTLNPEDREEAWSGPDSSVA
jgi:hypothetical protein